MNQDKSASKHASPFVLVSTTKFLHGLTRLLNLWLCLEAKIKQARLLAYPNKLCT